MQQAVPPAVCCSVLLAALCYGRSASESPSAYVGPRLCPAALLFQSKFLQCFFPCFLAMMMMMEGLLEDGEPGQRHPSVCLPGGQ